MKMSKPQYEAENIGCSCNDDDWESQWEWDEEQECYICSGCGEIQ